MNIGIFFNRYPKGGPNGAGYLYKTNLWYRMCMQEMLAELETAGARAVVVCTEETYVGNDTFSRYWVSEGDDPGYLAPANEQIRLDGLFDKGYFRGNANFSLVNVPGLAELGRDKAAQNALFGDMQPKTFTVETSEDFAQVVHNIPGELVVLKPNNLNGGRGVQILPKSELADYQPDGLTIVQQFIDGSQGVKGMGGGLHDLRLYMIDNEPAFASIRTPKAGSLISNTNQGGSIKLYDIRDIPEEPKAVAREVDTYVRRFGNRYYSVDLISGADRWYVVEINDRPGIPAQQYSPSAQAFQRRLATCIIDATKNPINHALQ